MAQKTYASAPLPFVGQKRNFINHFKKVLNEHIDSDGEGWTIIDVFGGSGLLAHNAKRLLPKARVIFNDFDDYHIKLKHIDDIERLRVMLLKTVEHVPRQTKIDNATRDKILQIIKDFNGFVCPRSVSVWLLFSGKQINSIHELGDHAFYNTVRLTPYKRPEGYLDGLEITKECFSALMPKFANDPKALFVLDPPYLCTRQGAYAMDKYFGMTKFLELMTHVRPPYVFFSSTRSELLDYLAYLKKFDPQAWNRIGGYQRISIVAKLNNTSKYEDNMIYKF